MKSNPFSLTSSPPWYELPNSCRMTRTNACGQLELAAHHFQSESLAPLIQVKAGNRKAAVTE